MKAQELFNKANVSFTFVGAAELLELMDRQPQELLPLAVVESASPRNQRAWVCLVAIPAYYEFITDDKGEMRNEMFEANVRDWEGDNVVNEAIRQSLEDKTHKEDFWWLNNGVTVLATDVTDSGGHILSVERPEIVNGLQTSRAIYNHCRPIVGTKGTAGLAQLTETETRNVLVRIIVTQQEDSSDHIIKATNSQTQVKSYRLHLTEKLHRNIEDVLRKHNLFYDRRKNHYKNEGRPIRRIVQPLNLAQTVISVLLQKPDDARARPTTVLVKEYDRVFNPAYSVQMYASCAMFIKQVDEFLLSRKVNVTRSDRTNIRWYVAMDYARALTKVPEPKADDLAAMVLPKDDALLQASYEKVEKIYQELGRGDKLAKGPDMVKTLKES